MPLIHSHTRHDKLCPDDEIALLSQGTDLETLVYFWLFCPLKLKQGFHQARVARHLACHRSKNSLGRDSA